FCRPFLTPPPLTSSLSPYPTLFRSLIVDAPAGRAGIPRDRAVRDRLGLPARDQDAAAEAARRVRVDGAGGECEGARAEDAAAAGDRKSTRLNSSHVAISYAVFCMKR